MNKFYKLILYCIIALSMCIGFVYGYDTIQYDWLSSACKQMILNKVQEDINNMNNHKATSCPYELYFVNYIENNAGYWRIHFRFKHGDEIRDTTTAAPDEAVGPCLEKIY